MGLQRLSASPVAYTAQERRLSIPDPTPLMHAVVLRHITRILPAIQYRQHDARGNYCLSRPVWGLVVAVAVVVAAACSSCFLPVAHAEEEA